MRTGMLITLMLFSIGCSENDLGDLKDISNPSDMDIEVSPAALDFGILSHGDPLYSERSPLRLLVLTLPPSTMSRFKGKRQLPLPCCYRLKKPFLKWERA